MEDVSLHTFVDASRVAYAAVSYVRYGHVNCQISDALVTAKARVTQIKSVSIPRLELMAAVLGVRLACWNGLWEAWNFTNSTHPLDVHYGRNLLDPGSLKTTEIAFVANRVAESQRKSEEAQWRHVPGDQNPADDATRGLDLRNLSAESRWFQGPTFLHEGETYWPLERRLLLNDCSEEGKQEKG